LLFCKSGAHNNGRQSETVEGCNGNRRGRSRRRREKTPNDTCGFIHSGTRLRRGRKVVDDTHLGGWEEGH
jgi:hypothetical protein